MPHSRPSLSITLPPDFEFHYTDGQLPKTPDQQHEEQAVVEPPPPPKQTYKIKRKPRNSIPAGEPSDIIPTIEMSEATDSLSGLSSPQTAQQTPSSHGLLAPMSAIKRATTPKTPAPRVHTAFEQVETPAREWDLINDSRDVKQTFERAGSVCSTFSDSSVSSAGSSAFSAPLSGSLSPNSETTDPFMDDEHSKEDKMLTSPEVAQTSPCAKRVKVHRHTKWTPAMDDHLWLTYMSYISDPTLTPFKMLPGTAPPLGVCQRVAAKAKRTWRDHRASSVGLLDSMLASSSKREGSPELMRTEATQGLREMKQPQWPRSEGATRRRLRELCKRKPSLSAHYQRLLRTRSPSPFHSSSSANRSSEPPTTSFSGSDMKMSLITSTNPSMQPDGPLAQLAGADRPPRPQSQRTERPADWFARIGRSQAHQKSMSLQSGLGLHSASLSSAHTLASPFDERTHILSSTAKSWGRNNFNVAAPSLDSPFEVSGAPTAPRSLKRRFRPDDDKPKRTAVQDIFNSSDANPIVRNRGFTVGAANASDNLAKLFTPPTITAPPPPPPMPTAHTSQDQEMFDEPELPDVSMLGPPGSRSAPRRLAEPTPRLGSPFVESAAAGRQFNTFPRSYIPSDSNPAPFQQRLKELAAQREGSMQDSSPL